MTTFFSSNERVVPEAAHQSLIDDGVHPLLAKLYASRGVTSVTDIGGKLGDLIRPTCLKGIEHAAQLLADALENNQKILIVGDYDCDGATATAVGIGFLRELGANVDFLIPNRLKHGYGLSPEVVTMAIERSPDWVITVDNGISDAEGVARMRQTGIHVIVTDHHLAPETLPPADAIVNPNQPGCTFPSKSLAGVGVIFYLMMQLRITLRERNFFTKRAEPNLANFLDLVALGTVADLVPLDRNNRILVAEGIKRVQSGNARPGITAILNIASRDYRSVTPDDFGFVVAPRLNAAGRLKDMSMSVECLSAADSSSAYEFARELDKLNHKRQTLQQRMIDKAESYLRSSPYIETITLFDKTWHEGIIGIVAGKLKEQKQKPVFIFAVGQDNIMKGSGRSVSGIHLYDVLTAMNARNPNLFLRFGGHAAAGGVSIRAEDFPLFQQSFEDIVREIKGGKPFELTLETDGSLNVEHCDLNTAKLIERQIWGQGFPPPVFVDTFRVNNVTVLNNTHLKLNVYRDGKYFDAVRFHCTSLPPANRADGAIRMAYRLTVNRYRGSENVKLQIEEWVK